jgi:hypothetical protein
VRDDALEQAARLEWLGIDHEAASFGPAEDEQVLDQAVEPLGLRAYVLQQCGARGIVVGSAGSGEDLGQAEDRRDRRP